MADWLNPSPGLDDLAADPAQLALLGHAIPGGGGGGGGSFGTLTGVPADNPALDAVLDSKATIYPPVVITGDTTLTAAAHANRLLLCTSASAINLTLQTDVAGSFASDDIIIAVQLGAGAVNILQGGATLRAVSGMRASTSAQYQMVGVQRVASNEWVPTEGGGGSGGAALFDQKSGIWLPGGAAAGTTFGLGFVSADKGTWTQQQHDQTSLFLQRPRGRWTSATSANAEAGKGVFLQRKFNNTGVGDLYGGWTAEIIAGVADSNTAVRTVIGFNLGYPTATVEPSAGTHFIAIAADSTDSNMYLMHNDSTGTATKIALTGSWPANSNAADLYRLRIKVNMYPTSSIEWWAENLVSGLTQNGTITTDMPVGAAHACAWRSNVATGVAVAIDLAGIGMGAVLS